MAFVSPARHILDLLVAAGGLGAAAGTADWALYTGVQPGIPDRVVTFYDTGGPETSPAWLLDYKTVQVRVRGKKGDYEIAQARAVAIQTALLGRPAIAMANGDRIDGIIQPGGIAFAGADANERPEFIFNLQLFIEPAALPGTHRASL
jgi:hypothetical protein